jgi:16S rRNA (guanine527-N7)-methyltransferase
MRPDLKDLLVAEAEKFSAKIGDAELALFSDFLALILKYNEKLSLTGIGDEDGIVAKHFIDSLAAHKFLEDSWFVLDIGSGMGCPGLALKIARPSLRMILLESNHKKAAFINQAIRALGLKDARAVAERAENKVFQGSVAARIDAVISRAVGKLDLLSELAPPYLKQGGRLIAYKGSSAERELLESGKAIIKNGFAEKEIFKYKLPFGAGDRALIVLEKV